MPAALRNLSTISTTAPTGTKTVTILGSAAVSPNSPTQAGDGLLFIDVAGAPIDAGGAPAGFGMFPTSALNTAIYLSVGRRVADSLDPGRGVTVTQTSGRNIISIAAFGGSATGDVVFGGANGISPATAIGTATSSPAPAAWTPPTGFTGKIITICAFKPASTAAVSATVTSGNTLLGPPVSIGSSPNILGFVAAITNADVSTYTPATFQISDSTGVIPVTALMQVVAIAPATTTTVLRPRTDGATVGSVSLVPALTVPGPQPQSLLLSDIDQSTMVKLTAGSSITVAIDTPLSKAMTFEADLICQDGASSTTWLMEVLEGTTVRASWTDTVTSTASVTTVSHALTSAQQATFGTGAVSVRISATAVS